jgi:hypothetical protein
VPLRIPRAAAYRSITAKLEHRQKFSRRAIQLDEFTGDREIACLYRHYPQTGGVADALSHTSEAIRHTGNEGKLLRPVLASTIDIR